MKAATAVTLLLTTCLFVSAPTLSRAQSNPTPTSGGSCSQVLPGTEGAVLLNASPLQSLFAALTSYGSLAERASAWLPEARTPAYVRAFAGANVARNAATHHAVYGRAAR